MSDQDFTNPQSSNQFGDDDQNQVTQEPEKPGNYQIGQFLPHDLGIEIPECSLEFDRNYFLRLLAGSISLKVNEKVRIIKSIPTLIQYQIDELTRIFEEEKRKFAELGEKSKEQLEKLDRQHTEEWKDVIMAFEGEKKAVEEQNQADEIRRKLGL
jgi:hypothetical protein